MAAKEDLVQLKLNDGNTATVHLYGATVISWKCKGEEVIFVSSKSHFDNKKAIRGGIPLVFPNFGPWDLGPQHGFARISRWNLEKSPHKNADGNTEAVFCLEDNEASRGMWDFRFKLIYTLVLSENSLKSTFRVQNMDKQPFSFTCLLHTYLKVPDVTKVTVSGLKGCSYSDKLKDGAVLKEERELVNVVGGMDCIYNSTGEEHVISNAVGNKSTVIKKTGFTDTVVWNPWEEKAKAMADFNDDGYKVMICVEAGNVSTPLTLQPSASYEGVQTISRL